MARKSFKTHETLMKALRAVLVAGSRVADPAKRSADLEYFFEVESEGGSSDLRKRIWFELELPIRLLGYGFTDDELTPSVRDVLQRRREKDRKRSILAWVEAKGSWHGALNQSPILAVLERGRLEFVDGWHRTKLARRSGQTCVRALIGVTKTVATQLSGLTRDE